MAEKSQVAATPGRLIEIEYVGLEMEIVLNPPLVAFKQGVIDQIETNQGCK